MKDKEIIEHINKKFNEQEQKIEELKETIFYVTHKQSNRLTHIINEFILLIGGRRSWKDFMQQQDIHIKMLIRI